MVVLIQHGFTKVRRQKKIISQNPLVKSDKPCPIIIRTMGFNITRVMKKNNHLYTMDDVFRVENSASQMEKF